MDTRDLQGGGKRKRKFGLSRGGSSPEDSQKTPSSLLGGADDLRSRLVVVAVSDPHPDPSEHHLEGIVLDAPPNLQRFQKAKLDLDNPTKLTEEQLKGATWKPGGTIRRYDPEAYEEHGTGVQHVKSYTNTALESALEKRESGSLKSSAEASGSPRTYVEKKGRTRTGRRIRHLQDVDKVI